MMLSFGDVDSLRVRLAEIICSLWHFRFSVS
jgi:hypothetical protein